MVATIAETSRPTRGAPDSGHERVAAIDIGSNSIRQIVADVAPDGNIRVVDELKAAPRLGAGMDDAGRLSDAAVDRATESISRMATLARQLGATRIEVVATSAVREASNAREFLGRVQQAARVSENTAFFFMGKLVETAETDTIFTSPKEPRTEAYVTGRFG